MRKPRHIYIIDDDAIFMKTSQILVQRTAADINITLFQNATKAIESLQQTIMQERDSFPDIIFLDLSMPEKDGWQFVEAYQKLPTNYWQQCKLIILTTSIDPRDADKAATYPSVDTLVSKPINCEWLQALLN